jgi:dienelactone hydrolase
MTVPSGRNPAGPTSKLPPPVLQSESHSCLIVLPAVDQVLVEELYVSELVPVSTVFLAYASNVSTRLLGSRFQPSSSNSSFLPSELLAILVKLSLWIARPVRPRGRVFCTVEIAQSNWNGLLLEPSEDCSSETTPSVYNRYTFRCGACVLSVTAEVFLSDGIPITVEVFQGEDGPRPGVLLLHGVNGLKSGHEAHRRLATHLVSCGYSVFFIHYFNSTKTLWADRDTIRDSFFTWRKAVIDGLKFASSHPAVAGAPMGMLGFSLGAALGLTVAGRLRKVRAIAEFSGELPEAAFALMTGMPPTLIVHGGGDEVVPVGQAYKIEKWLKEQNVPCEIRVYPDEKHVLRESAAADAITEVIAFFDQHLRRGGEEGHTTGSVSK